MAHLNAKENYLKVIKGEIPEYLPFYTMFGEPWHDTHPTKSAMINPSGNTARSPQGGIDIWGVPYVANAEAGFAALPKPGAFILEDITKWDKVIKKPVLPEIDWELMAKRDIEKLQIDRSQTMLVAGGGIGPFQQLMAFMGFNEGLCAMYEEPEAVNELFDYVVSYYLPICENVVKYYKPDIFNMADDTAAKLNPFVSPEVYRELLKPYYAMQAKYANEAEIYIEFHNCGRCEDLIPDMLDFGVKLWDPAQTDNDLVGIMEKYQDKLVVVGGWDWHPPVTYPHVDEEYVRASVREAIDKYAPGGHFIFCGGATGAAGDEVIPQVNAWVTDEVWEYGHKIYK